MRSLRFLLGTLLLAAAPLQAAAPRDPEAALSRLLEGRQAGEPVDCINLRSIRSSRVIKGTAIVYDAGGTLYVNRPRAGADSLDDRDALVLRTTLSRLCSIDTLQTFDTASGFYTGNVFLGEFVPYRRAKRD